MTRENPYLIPFAIIVAGILISAGLFFGLNAKGGSGAVINNPGTGTSTGTGGTTSPSIDTAQVLSSISFAPYEGNSNAPVTILEFGDYQCPFCERHFTQTEPQIMSNYVDTGKAKFYFLDFAFLGPDSVTLAEGAWCANDQDKYYDYYNYVFSNQGQENSGWATPDKVKAFVVNINGINAQQFNSCLDSKKYESRVQDLTQLGRSVGVSGTPSFLIITSASNMDSSKLSSLQSLASQYGQNLEVGIDQTNNNVVVMIVGALPYSAFDQVLKAMT